MKAEILKEAKRLYDLGCAVHFIKPNSKAPVKAGWSGPVRDDWKVLEREYQEGFGLGVRLGESSKIGKYFLANIDVDIKSEEPRHREEALKVVAEKFPELKGAPTVKTGYGLRFFALTKTPLKSGKVAASAEVTRVFMPTAPINRQQELAVAEGLLSQQELRDGWRVRTAWEVELMSSGKQVVLPPSIHPDTGRAYTWERPWNGKLPPEIALDGLAGSESRGKERKGVSGGFKPVIVDMVSSDLPDSIVGAWLTGDGVGDRSAALFSVAMAMCRARFTDSEILTALTDRESFLGEVAYEHAATGDRWAAAEWVKNYTLAKAREETSAAKAFKDAVVVDTVLDETSAGLQVAELVPVKDWKERLTRSGRNGEGPPRDTLLNLVSILANEISPSIFRWDIFADRESYGAKTPWGSKAGELITDRDTVAIKEWIGVKFKYEPSCNTVHEAIAAIARRNAYHPVRDELEALEAWDGTRRLDVAFQTYFGAKGDPEYMGQVFRKWLVGSVRRTFEPGTKFDWMPILEGLQGTGKSTFGVILFGDEYFTDGLPSLYDKDAALALQGIRCVEFGELASISKTELEVTKQFLSRSVDKVRPPYGRRVVELRRQCIFFGTTNLEEYLKDDTGNRRMKPVVVGQLDFDALKADREQLWAEALFLYREGFDTNFELDGDAKKTEVKVHAEKMVADEAVTMADLIRDHMGKVKAGGAISAIEYCGRFGVHELFSDGGPLHRFSMSNPRMPRMAAKALKTLGAHKVHTRNGKKWFFKTL